jgi:hypothetical protein
VIDIACCSPIVVGNIRTVRQKASNHAPCKSGRAFQLARPQFYLNDVAVIKYSRSLVRSRWENFMKKLVIIGATIIGSMMLCAVPVSLHISQEKVVSVALDTADAVIGRPATPGSVAGVARRTTRRAVRRRY